MCISKSRGVFVEVFWIDPENEKEKGIKLQQLSKRHQWLVTVLLRESCFRVRVQLDP